MATSRTAARSRPASRKGNKGRPRKAPVEPRRGLTWFALTLMVVGGMLALRLGVNALQLFPVHFDEAQYWAYGQDLDWGYFSKPPLVGALIRLSTDALGDSLFALRLFVPLAHALVAWMIYMCGARIWDGRTGFWAATGYTFAPGVGFSAMIATTDPAMMACWAIALYAFIRGLEAKGLAWWVLCGVAIGLGLLAKYTMIAFPLAALGYLATSPNRGRIDWRGFGVACGVGLLAFAPNIYWNAINGFATVSHVAEDADPGHGYFNPGKMAEFLGAQLAVIGPAFFLALFPALFTAGRWREDAGMRLAAWQTWLVLGGFIALSLVTRANGNWAAPAYVGGSLMAARWLLTAGWRRWLIAQVAVGATLLIVLYAAAAFYSARAEQLPKGVDPFRKTRLGPAFCERALAAMEDEQAVVLLSGSRHRLSECMFMGDLDWDEVAIWNPDLVPENHHELIATLRKGDARRMIVAVTGDGTDLAGRFAERTRLDRGEIRTHRDRAIAYDLWVVEGFEGYGVDD